MRYLLDEDVNPEAARAARDLELDVVSVHELDRRGTEYPDRSQLTLAAGEERVLVTRNRDDYIRLTVEFFRTGQAHRGVLVIPYGIPNKHPGRIARALKHWDERHSGGSAPQPYLLDFLR